MRDKIIKRFRRILAQPEPYLEKQMVLNAQILAKLNRGIKRWQTLSDAEFSGFSQWGEDGIIDWLIEHLPSFPRTFIEFGVEDYRESNTRLLLHLRNWRGLIMDGSEEHISNIQGQDIYWRYNLTAIKAFIDQENINKLISEAGFNGDIGLVSIDIDGNDYWVWKAIDVVRPVIVVCEYNAIFGDLLQLTVPYEADFQRTRAHRSNLYFGASLQALVNLGKYKGYTFIGTTSTGCNAFFVRDDYASDITCALEKITAFPSSVRESRDLNGRLTFVSGLERIEIIKYLPILDLDRNRITTLAECGEIYSPLWAS